MARAMQGEMGIRRVQCGRQKANLIRYVLILTPASGRLLTFLTCAASSRAKTQGTVAMAYPHYLQPFRTLTSVEEAEDEKQQNSLHINATGLPASCEGCSVALTLIQTSLCGTTDAHDSALQVPLQDALTYVTNENGSTDGWKTQYFRELHDSNKTLPVSLVDVLNPNPATTADYKMAVYLYDMEENPIACATLEPASEEEAKMYADMFYGGDDVTPLGDEILLLVASNWFLPL
eukprot:scaffold517_cov140-Skeletonema_marinoi.AAC.5